MTFPEHLPKSVEKQGSEGLQPTTVFRSAKVQFLIEPSVDGDNFQIFMEYLWGDSCCIDIT